MPDGTNDIILSDVQKEFLRKYLDGGIFFTPKADKEKTKNYKKFLRVYAAAEQHRDRLDPAGPDAARVTATMARALVHKEQGAFAQAFTVAQEAFLDAVDVLQRIERKEALLLRQAAIVIPTSADAVDRGVMTTRLTNVTDTLAGTPPSTAELDTAEADLAALESLRGHAEDRGRKRAGDAVYLATTADAALARLGVLDAQIARTDRAPNHTDLLREAARLRDELREVRAAVRVGNDGVLDIELGDLKDCLTDLDQLAADTETALKSDMLDIEMMRYRTGPEVEALKNLMVVDPAQKDAAAAALDGFDQVLNGRPIDQAALVAAEQAVEDARNDIANARAARQAALDAKAVLTAQLQQERQATEGPLQAAVDQTRAEADAFYRLNRAVLEDPTHEEYQNTRSRYALEFERLRDAAQLQFDQAQRRLLAGETARLRAADAAITQARAAVVNAKTAYADRVEEQTCAEGKKRLLDAISYGALSPDRTTAMTAEDKIALMELYTVNPKLADHAATCAAGAAEPRSVVTVAQTAAARVEDRFGMQTGPLSSRDGAEDYAKGLVDMAVVLRPEEAEELEAYLDEGRHLQPCRAMVASGSTQKSGKKRVDHVSAALVGADGRLDFDAGREAFLDVTFHPDAVMAAPSLAQVPHMRETMAFLEGSNNAQDIIYRMPDPQDGGAAILARATGQPFAQMDASVARREVVGAMLTPVYQGKVGSCFVTGPLRKMREDQPLAVMEGLAKLATEGVFEPAQGDPVPAVHNIQRDQNGLLRSYEYSAATATARLTESLEREQLGKMLGRAATLLGKAIKVKVPPEEKDALIDEMMNEFEFQYRYDRASEGEDGHSTQGRFVLVRKSDQVEVQSPLSFMSGAVKPLARRKGGLKPSDVKFLRKIAKDPRLAQSMKVHGEAPWELPGGGFGVEAIKVLEGDDTARQKMSDAVDPATMNRNERVKDMMRNISRQMGLTRAEKVPASVTGTYNHAFNLTPNHPSMRPFISPDPDKAAEAVEERMLAPARQVSTTQMPVERLVFLYDREMQALMTKTSDDAGRAALEAAWPAHVPTAPMTPREFADHLEVATDAWADALAQAVTDDWAARETAAGRTPDPATRAAEEAKFKAEAGTMRETMLADRLMQDFDLPQVVIADTNWGGPHATALFVMAADPLSGEARLYVKMDPSGELQPLEGEENWLAGAWNIAR